MTARYLLNKHREFWTQVEANVWDDLLQAIPETPAKVRRRIAYNAAFNATYAYHKGTK
jgi:hypothetical protein